MQQKKVKSRFVRVANFAARFRESLFLDPVVNRKLIRKLTSLAYRATLKYFRFAAKRGTSRLPQNIAKNCLAKFDNPASAKTFIDVFSKSISRGYIKDNDQVRLLSLVNTSRLGISYTDIVYLKVADFNRLEKVCKVDDKFIVFYYFFTSFLKSCTRKVVAELKKPTLN
ncbi:MAG: hypothetical protein QXX06_03780 [Candidatus Diapherotrites archaeon]